MLSLSTKNFQQGSVLKHVTLIALITISERWYEMSDSA